MSKPKLTGRIKSKLMRNALAAGEVARSPATLKLASYRVFVESTVNSKLVVHGSVPVYTKQFSHLSDQRIPAMLVVNPGQLKTVPGMPRCRGDRDTAQIYRRGKTLIAYDYTTRDWLPVYEFVDEELLNALLHAVASLARAASAYRKHASRHKSRGRATPDALFGMRADNFDNAVEVGRAVLRRYGKKLKHNK